MVNNWHEVTLKQYFEILKIQKSDKTDTEKTLDLLQLFSDVDNFEELKLSELHLHTPDLRFLQDAPQSVEIGSTIEVGGKTYDVATDKTMTSLQFIGFNQAYKSFDETKIESVTELMSNLLCEQGKKFSEDGKPDAKALEGLPCEVAFSLITFFLPTSVSLSIDMPTFFSKIVGVSLSMQSSVAQALSFLDTDSH